MEPYNVKILTFPDLSKRVFVYHSVVSGDIHRHKEIRKEPNPFDGRFSEVLKMSIDSYNFRHVDEVSLKRTRKKVFEYAGSNTWDYFCTFTFDKKQVDRFDFDDCVRKLSKWLNNLRRSSPGLSYLVVPERHKNGAWHFHGLFSGFSDSDVLDTGKYVIKRRNDSVVGRARFERTSDKIYKIGRYKLGWMTATKIKDMARVTGYITKYITKDMMQGLPGRKRYWVSRNLQLPIEEKVLIDDDSKFVLRGELEEAAAYATASEFSYGSVYQVVNVYDLKL